MAQIDVEISFDQTVDMIKLSDPPLGWQSRDRCNEDFFCKKMNSEIFHLGCCKDAKYPVIRVTLPYMVIADGFANQIDWLFRSTRHGP